MFSLVDYAGSDEEDGGGAEVEDEHRMQAEVVLNSKPLIHDVNENGFDDGYFSQFSDMRTQAVDDPQRDCPGTSYLGSFNRFFFSIPSIHIF